MKMQYRTLGYFGLQALLGLAGWAYLVLAITAAGLMVLIIGLPVVFGVIMLGRALAAPGLAVARWLTHAGPSPVIEPLPPANGPVERVKTALSYPGTWRVLAWHAFNALTLPITLLALLVLPVAAFWDQAHLQVTWFLLAPKGTKPPALPAQPWTATLGQDSSRLPATTGVEGGHGLLGMRERAVALGGSFNAAHTQAGGYQVRAVLPID